MIANRVTRAVAPDSEMLDRLRNYQYMRSIAESPVKFRAKSN
ncbi:MAG: hypothetical protein OXN84_03570 [Albidovulum sp.]|nr:hypothetical protein [Albidovulum sp.]